MGALLTMLITVEEQRDEGNVTAHTWPRAPVARGRDRQAGRQDYMDSCSQVTRLSGENLFHDLVRMGGMEGLLFRRAAFQNLLPERSLQAAHFNQRYTWLNERFRAGKHVA